MRSDRNEDRSAAEKLRRAFDESFVDAPAAFGARPEDFLAVRVGGHPYAIRLSEVAGLFRDRKIVPVASPMPELLGLAGFRGLLSPVYDLGTLLGHSATEAPRWLALARGSTLVGLAFGLFEEHLRVSAESLSMEQPGDASRCLSGVVRGPELLRPIIHVPSVIEAIAQRVDPQDSSKES